MASIFGGFTKAINNKLTTIGFGNHVFNIVNVDGKESGYEPKVDWNTTPQLGNGLSALLEWRTRLTPLIGRTTETKQLLDWANEPHPLSFKIVQAQGGVGKTRLAAEVAQALVDTKKWTAGFVSLIDFHGAHRLRWQGDWLVVVDYPEHAPERLAALLRAAKAGLTNGKNDKLRVLLLCRTPEGIHDKLNDASVNGYLSTPIQLEELPQTDNFRLLTQALAKLATTAQNPSETLPTVNEAEFVDWQALSTLHQTALFVIALAIHLSSAPSVERRFLPGKYLLKDLVDREQKRWHKAEYGLQLPHGTLADVVAMATLFNGLTASGINNAMATAYGWTDATRNSIFTALGEVWPAHQAATHVYPSMAPDLLAAAFLWQWQSAAVKQSNPHDIQGLTVLAAQHGADIASLVQRWHMLAYDQTVRLDIGLPQQAGALNALLHSAFDKHEHFAEQLKEAFTSCAKWPALEALAVASSRPQLFTEQPGDTTAQASHAHDLHNHAVYLANAGDRVRALVAAREAVEIRRRLTKAAPTSFEPDLASSINNLSNRLSESGDIIGALMAAREAVEIRRRLARAAPVSFEPDLASSINNLANRLGDGGDRAGALVAAREAVDIRRRLAMAVPASFEPDLAMSINNLANYLSESGDRAGALLAARESVDIYRRLAKAAPASFEPDLAMSINNLAAILSKTGDRAGALVAAREAVEIRRRLAKAAPASFEPDLAMSINNLASFLSESGDRAEALLAGREAVDIYRSLATAAPASFEPGLAASINNLANFLSDSGDRAGAVVAAREAVDIRRRLAKVAPASFEPDLTMSINNLSTILSESGDRVGALVAACEAVEIRRRLVKAAPASFEPNLAASINNLAIILSRSGEHAGALMAAREAVEIRRRLARAAPVSFEPDLASSINNLANRLGDGGDRAGALVAAREAVDIYRHLAKAAPAIFEPNLASSITNLAHRLSQSGDRSGALVAAREALDIRRRLAKTAPASFEPDLAMSLGTLMACLAGDQQVSEALKMGKQALDLFERLNKQHGGVFEEQVQQTRHALGGLQES